MKTLLFISSQSGFDLKQIPLGGPASIADSFETEWRKRSDIEFRTLSSALLGSEAPRNEDFLKYTPTQYIDFFSKFEKAVFAEILRYDPQKTVVLSNDSLRFRPLTEKGYSIYVIHHMNVVDYFTNALLHGCIKSQTAFSIFHFMYACFGRLVPKALKMVFLNQEESVLHTRGSIVPSEGLKRNLLQLYPLAEADRIHVLPWGSHAEIYEDHLLQARKEELRQRYAIKEDTLVLITLSRISPEKGQDRLLKALELWEKDPGYPSQGIVLLLCGTAGYVQAKPYERALIQSTKKLKKVRVLFPGYVHGLEKQAHFQLADLYIFPSRHESYGLTLMEAFSAGLPAVGCRNDGTEQLLHSDYGELLPAATEDQIPHLLKEAMERIAADPEKRRAMGRKAKEFSDHHPFSKTADDVVRLLIESGGA